jgi:hypothetical protein
MPDRATVQRRAADLHRTKGQESYVDQRKISLHGAAFNDGFAAVHYWRPCCHSRHSLPRTRVARSGGSEIGPDHLHALAGLPAAERARDAWAAFTAAMDELAADHNGGWTIFGAGHRRAHQGSQRIEEARWLHVRGVTFVDEPEPRLPRGFITVERHHPINLPSFTSDRLEEIAL